MKCYHCGATLNKYNFCTACKSDVRLYKRAISASNILYNEAIEKASVRNLSGAIDDLRESIRINGENIDARNLLGLVYYEIGEVISALNEWMISTRITNKKNIATDYIKRLEKNQNKLEDFVQAVKKYNMAIDYCKQDSLDLVNIQLKKVVLLNPKFIEAKLLLALFYMNECKWNEANKLILEVLSIDKANVKANRYFEVSKLKAQPKSKLQKIRENSKEVVRYEAGNELIIRPAKVKEPRTSTGAIAGFVLGVLIGAGILFFLILPGQVQNVRNTYEEDIRMLNEQLDASKSTNTNLESQLKNIQLELEGYNTDYVSIIGENADVALIQSLLEGVGTYLNDPTNLEAYTPKVDKVIVNKDYFMSSSKAIKDLYESYLLATGATIGEEYFKQAQSAYATQDYTLAIELYSKTVLYDEQKVEAWYYLANSYREIGDEENAKMTYQKVKDTFPDTEKADWAQGYLREME